MEAEVYPPSATASDGDNDVGELDHCGMVDAGRGEVRSSAAGAAVGVVEVLRSLNGEPLVRALHRFLGGEHNVDLSGIAVECLRDLNEHQRD